MKRKYLASCSEGDVDNNIQERVHEDDRLFVMSGYTNNDDVEHNSKANESHLLNIPFHILEMIMECSSGVEYLNFRATCKLCCLAAPLLKWSSQTTRMSLQIYSSVSPWLVEVNENRGAIILKHPIIGDKYLTDNFPYFTFSTRICYSMFGWWLCYYPCSGRLVFFNPFTFDRNELPTKHFNLISLCFSAPPTSPDCMVVGFTLHHVFIHFGVGDASCNMFTLDLGGTDPYCPIFNAYSPIFNGRDLYVLCNEGQLNVFEDLGHKDYARMQVVAEAPQTCCRSPTGYYLMKCHQHLLQVIIEEDGETIEVFAMKMTCPTKKWKKINRLGKYMIYICGVSSICIEAKSPQMKNKIYFPRVHKGNGKIVFYSLETCRYHTFDDKKIEECYVNISETIHHDFPCAWIEPTFP